MKPPSFRVRVVLALAFLVGFYLLMVSAALVLLALPVFVVIQAHHFGTWVIFMFGICWIPAALLLQGIFTVQPAPFVAPGPRLERHEAPALFALIDDLAARAQTAPPAVVHLAPTPTLAVTQRRSERILIIGLPLLDAITVQELRAGIAHELGHFAGGDTRLTSLLVYTSATFASVFESVQRGAFKEGSSHGAIELGLAAAKALGEGLTKGYAHLYFRVMRASSRRQELAADALAAALAGRAATMRLLEKVSLIAPTYDLYVASDVGFAVAAGAMPTDLLGGYREFRAALDLLPLGARIAEARRTEKTDPFDSHPATPIRLDRLRALPEGPIEDDARLASTFLVDPARAHDWLTEVTMNALEPRQTLLRTTWAEIPSKVYTPHVVGRANQMAASLHPLFPEAQTIAAMFVSVVRAFERGDSARVVGTLVQGFGAMQPGQRAHAVASLGGRILGTLFEGALVDRGGVIHVSFGAPSLVVMFGEEGVPAAKIANDAMTNEAARALLSQWATRLSV